MSILGLGEGRPMYIGECGFDGERRNMESYLEGCMLI